MGGRLLRIGVTVFPGSNCDRDALYAVERMGAEPVELWHADADLKGVDAVIVPGGFSYGDYLRPGAIARFAKVMGPLEEFAKEGGPVLGVCNGFQVLTEAHLLPGALLRNTHMRFVCDRVRVRVETTSTPWTAALAQGEELTLPVAHNEGNYFADARDARRAWKTRGGSCCATSRTRTARRTTSRVSATRAGTSSASCRIPSASRTPRSAQTRGCSILRSVLVGAGV